jgi:hypothetical protein
MCGCVHLRVTVSHCVSHVYICTYLAVSEVCSSVAVTDSEPQCCQRPVCNPIPFVPQGGLSAQAFVRVELEDVNDNRPVFNPPTYVTSISREAQPGTEVISVLASDRDLGVYGTVSYELLPGDLSSHFSIDSTTGT